MTSSASQSSKLIVNKMRGQLQDQLVLAKGVFQRLGIDMPRAQPARLDRQPAMGFLVLIPFQDKVAVLPRVKVPQLRESLLHLFEEMQDRVAVVGQLHLGVEVNVDVKVVGIANIAIHPCDPEFSGHSARSKPGQTEGIPPNAKRLRRQIVSDQNPVYHNRIAHEMNGDPPHQTIAWTVDHHDVHHIGLI